MRDALNLPQPKKLALIIGGFFIVGFLIYGHSLQNDFVTWDDIGLIVENPDITSISPTTVKNVFSRYDPELYIPLTFMSYQVDYAVGGLHPFMYHASNLLFHTLNALLVTLLLWILLRSGWLSIGLGLLFLVHPLNTEAVAWASSRKDVLSTLFFLLSLILYLVWRTKPQRRYVVLSLLLFTAGLLSKVMVISLPIVLFLLDWLEDRKIDKSLFIEKIPYLVLSVALGIIALFGKASILATTTPAQKLLMAAKSAVFYIPKFVMPYGLTFAYPYNGVIRLMTPAFFIPVLICIAVIIASWKYRKRYRMVVFGIVFYILTLLPTFSNFAKGGDIYIASDRYAYIPMIGLLIVLGFVIETWLQSVSTERAFATRRRSMITATFVCLFGFSVVASVQATTWKNSEALYSHALQYQPESRAAHHNLAMEYLRMGDAEKALQEFDTALAIKDDPRSHINKGAAYVMLKKFTDAKSEYEYVLKDNPENAEALYGLGNVEYKQGNKHVAVDLYKKALAINPEYTNALNNLGGLYIELEDWDSAIDVLQQSLRLQPDFPESFYNLGGAYESKGLFTEAEQAYRSALSLRQNDADTLAHLATVLYNQNKVDDAAKYLGQAFQENGYNTTAHALLERMKKDGVAE